MELCFPVRVVIKDLAEAAALVHSSISRLSDEIFSLMMVISLVIWVMILVMVVILDYKVWWVIVSLFL